MLRETLRRWLKSYQARLGNGEDQRKSKRWSLRCNGLLMGITGLLFLPIGLEKYGDRPLTEQFGVLIVFLLLSAFGWALFIYSFKMRR